VAEIRVVSERRDVWPWMAWLVALVLVLWMAAQTLARPERAVQNDALRLLQSHPAAAATRPAGEAAPAPNPAALEEEALRVRSRIMA
jgi:hypothetical protein